MTREEIGTLIRERREALGWSRYKLSKITGMYSETIATYENGKYRPSAQSARKLAEALGIEAARLVEGAKGSKKEEIEVHPHTGRYCKYLQCARYNSAYSPKYCCEDCSLRDECEHRCLNHPSRCRSAIDNMIGGTENE